jgi:glutathione S-transferase
VPLVLIGDEVLFESAVILDYLDEVYSPQLHPDDPLQRKGSWMAAQHLNP